MTGKQQQNEVLTDIHEHFKACGFFLNTYLSKVAASMYLPFGENFTKDTGGLSSSTVKIKVIINQRTVALLHWQRISFDNNLLLVVSLKRAFCFVIPWYFQKHRYKKVIIFSISRKRYFAHKHFK